MPIATIAATVVGVAMREKEVGTSSKFSPPY
jgi:hypothetical protein